MVTIDIEGDHLTVAVRGIHKVLALKRRLSVPLSHVRGATADPGIRLDPASLRSPGTHVPGVVAAGTYREGGEKTFWAVRERARAVVIELHEHEYRRLVVEVADPRDTVERIERAVATR